MKISFETTRGWSTVHVSLLDGCGREVEGSDLPLQNGACALEADGHKFTSVRFSGEDGESTSICYHGGYDIGISYRYNEKLGRHLTYIVPECERTGRVETFVLHDEKNLSHREDRSKKINVFLPRHYDEKGEKCDILYFFDAQNLFCRAGKYTDDGDPYGSWQLDATLDAIHRKYGRNVIVVGIDNADAYRNWELFMDPEKFGTLSELAYLDPREDFSRGYLDHTSEFIRYTLHPYIKEKYNVSEDNIGIGGSSMGGLASFYCGMRELGFYSYVLSYSPAYGLYEMADYDRYLGGLDLANKRELQPKLHVYCGGGDPLEELLLPSSREMCKRLVTLGYDENKIFETYDTEKLHNEESWRLVLPQSFKYLLDL